MRSSSCAASDKLAVRDGGRTVRVELGSIRWIDAAGDYMCIHTDGETPLADDILRATMRELEKQLDPQRFPRIHRSTIVNARRVVETAPAHQRRRLPAPGLRARAEASRSHRDKVSLLL